MFKRAALLLLLTGSVAILGHAQKADTDDDRTNGLLNGRFWTKLPEHGDKVWFVIGYCEGAAVDGLAKCPAQSEFGEIVRGIDRFYQEPENLRLPFMAAVKIFAMKVTGAKATEIEAFMDRVRKDADAPLPKK